MADDKAAAEKLVPKFQLKNILNQDQGGRRIILQGSIGDDPALLILERAPFSNSTEFLSALPANLRDVQNLGINDVYFWYLAAGGSKQPEASTAEELPADLKINLIYPCTDQHIKKYSRQGFRSVCETPTIYKEKVRPYMEMKRSNGRLNWIYNIIQGVDEAESVIFRTPLGKHGDEGFLLMPDLNWDRRTITSMHLLALVERTDIWSIRDLRKKHIAWLRHMRKKLISAAAEAYAQNGVDSDQLKLYVHYQPTYYHFHVHIVHVALESGATQATGKAIGLESLIEQLRSMEGDHDAGLDEVDLTYTIGEASELWTDIFEPLRTMNTASQLQ